MVSSQERLPKDLLLVTFLSLGNFLHLCQDNYTLSDPLTGTGICTQRFKKGWILGCRGRVII